MQLIRDSKGRIDWAASHAELDRLQKEEATFHAEVEAVYQEKVLPLVEAHYQARLDKRPMDRYMPLWHQAAQTVVEMRGKEGLTSYEIERVRIYLKHR